MSTALNLGITRRWTEQPMPVHYVTGLQLAEELVAAGVPIDLARATITSVCLASKNERPPKTLGYFREPILEAFRGAEQRALNDAAARGGAAKRGLAPIANVVSADRANGERADRAAYDVARRAAATAWINDPANRAALARVKHTLDEKYAKIAESGWKARAYEADFVIAIAETVGFPNFETWAAQRTPATSGVA